MEDAVVSLQSAVDELRMAQDALDGELSDEVAKVIRHTQEVLDAVRQRMSDSGAR